MKENLNYSVSGVGGFIGSRFHERLTRDGHSVKRIGRYATRVPDTDVFIDCASFGNLYNQKNISETYFANVERAIDLVLENQNEDYKAFVLLSTSAVTLPHQTYYSASKRAMEEFVKIYAKETGKPVVAVRPYSVTGVGEQESHLIPKLIDSCINGTPMPFVGDPVHDFIDVDDFVNGVLTVAAYANENPGAIYSIGSGKQYSNQEVREIVEKVVGKRANITVNSEPMRKYDTKEWVADTTAMYSLGWRPKRSMEETIERMVKDYELK